MGGKAELLLEAAHEGASPTTRKRHSYDVTEHKLTLEELQKQLQTSLNEEVLDESEGLTSEEAKRRLARDGPNAMSPPKSTPEIIKYLRQFTNPFMVLLSIASALSFTMYRLDTKVTSNLACGVALAIIVILQCTITYLEERKSNDVMALLKNMVPAMCRVIRDGKPRRVPAAELVVGDVVQLKGGDRVPADLRIVQTSGLKVECSSLTGESDAIEVTLNPTHEEPHESRNLVFNTSQCIEGSAVGVVIRTADQTLIGIVAALASDTSSTVTTLQREVQRVVQFIAAIALLMSLGIMAIGFGRKLDGFVVVNLVITIFAANIPQGLPATVTACLGIAAKRMSHRNVLVKNLEVIETLGAATCICSDKTGTLTQNKMSVQNFWFNGSYEMLNGGVVVGIGGSTYLSTTDTERRRRDANATDSRGFYGATRSTSGDINQQMFIRWRANPLEPLLLIAAVCNSAYYADEESTESRPSKQAAAAVRATVAPSPRYPTGMLEATKKLPRLPDGGYAARVTTAKFQQVSILGDASESALMRYCDCVYPVGMIRTMYPRVFDQPFNSTVKYALCVVDPPEEECPGKHLVFLKGAPEVVIERCSRWLVNGVEKPVDDDFRKQFQVAYERFASAGERVLGFASQIVDKRPIGELSASTVPTKDFIFIGLASLMDPPKPGVDHAVLDCHQAGIRVFMVTGDHALTAEAIARKVNIITLPTRKDLAHERRCDLEAVDPRDPDIEAVVVTGSELKTYTDEQWEWLLPHKELVFARTTPTQKLEIVQRLQERGEIVAVTGDGVNDSPALKKADIGVAMGNPAASDVAREAADIIVLDDDFCSIVNAIREGRLLFDNLKKSIAYTLTHLMPEIVPVALAIILNVPLGLAPMLILTIDLGSELLPAISLAYEEPESAIMHRPPRNTKTDQLVSLQVEVYAYGVAGMLQSVVCTAAYFGVFWSYGINVSDLVGTSSSHWSIGSPAFVSNGRLYTDAEQTTILSVVNGAWYANLILCQMFHLWFTRTRLTSVTQHPLFSNTMCWLAMFWELAFILEFCCVREFQPVFISGDGLPIQFWLISLAFLALIAIYSETVKYWARADCLYGKPNFMAALAW